MQKDYIMRIVEQFVQALLAIMRRRKAGEYKEAREQVRTTARYLLRTDIDLLLLYDPDQILDHFKDFSDRLETEKCILGADLFHELALIEEAEKQPAAALRLKMLCLHLYTTALPKEQQFQEPQYFEKVATLIEELKDHPLSEKIQLSLRSYEEFIAVKKIENSFFSSGNVTVPNGELYFESTGEGEPLIFIHAGFSDRRDWNHQIEPFGKEFNTIVYDQRGSGKSSVPTIPFSPADDLKAIMDHLKITKTAVIGHSLGGTIALDFALQYPERVSSLILVAPGLNGHVWSTEHSEWFKTIWSLSQLAEMTKQAMSASFYMLAMDNPDIKSEIEMITKENLEKILAWKNFDLQWFFPEPISKLKELKTPTFVAYGNKDSQDIKQIVHTLSENLPNIKVIQVQNADHLLNFEQPHELNTLILNFLKDRR